MLAYKRCKLSLSLDTVCLPEDLIPFPSDRLLDKVLMESSRGVCSWDWTLPSTHNKSLKTPPSLQSLEAVSTELCLCTTLFCCYVDGGKALLVSDSSHLILDLSFKSLHCFLSLSPMWKQRWLMKMTGDVITALLAPMPRLLPAKLEYFHWVANKMCASKTSTTLSTWKGGKREWECHFFL